MEEAAPAAMIAAAASIDFVLMFLFFVTVCEVTLAEGGQTVNSFLKLF